MLNLNISQIFFHIHSKLFVRNVLHFAKERKQIMKNHLLNSSNLFVVFIELSNKNS